ncbi:hypothetical protein [Desulfobulbus propionicus]
MTANWWPEAVVNEARRGWAVRSAALSDTIEPSTAMASSRVKKKSQNHAAQKQCATKHEILFSRRFKNGSGVNRMPRLILLFRKYLAIEFGVQSAIGKS